MDTDSKIMPKGVRSGSFAIDRDGLVEDNFLVYIASERLMSPETKQKIVQIKGHTKSPEIKRLTEQIFRMGYGAAVWDHRIGLDDNKESNATKEVNRT